jgi:hypothetical protein
VKRIIVTGGRDYHDAAAMRRTFASLIAWHGPLEINEGGCPTGADAGARWLRCERGLPGRTYEADWDRHGRSAGPIRNSTMLREVEPRLVVHFPGGRGTADMVQKARVAGVRIAEVCCPDESSDESGR